VIIPLIQTGNLGTGRLSDLPTGMQGAVEEQEGEASWFES